MACDVPELDWRRGITVRRVGLAVAAGAIAAVAIALSTDQTANLLFLVSGLLFAGGFGIPVATAAEVGNRVGCVDLVGLAVWHPTRGVEATRDRCSIC